MGSWTHSTMYWKGSMVYILQQDIYCMKDYFCQVLFSPMHTIFKYICPVINLPKHGSENKTLGWTFPLRIKIYLNVEFKSWNGEECKNRSLFLIISWIRRNIVRPLNVNVYISSHVPICYLSWGDIRRFFGRAVVHHGEGEDWGCVREVKVQRL